MRSTQQFSITLPNEMAEAVRGKVAAGEYASESVEPGEAWVGATHEPRLNSWRHRRPSSLAMAGVGAPISVVWPAR